MTNTGNGTSGSFNFTWNAIPNAITYVWTVTVKGVGAGGNSGTVNGTQAGPFYTKAGQIWTFTVRGMNASRTCSGPSSSVTVIVPTHPKLLPIPAPSNLQASCPRPGMSASLTWTDNYIGPNNWDIKVTDITAGNTTVVLDTNFAGSPSLTLRTSFGHIYSWSISATDVSGFPKSKTVKGPDFNCHIPLILH